MNIQHLINGNLEISGNKGDIKEIKYLLSDECPDFKSMISKESFFIVDMLGYEDVTGQVALFSGPAMSDGENIWGYEQYAVMDFLEELAAGNSVEWTKG